MLCFDYGKYLIGLAIHQGGELERTQFAELKLELEKIFF